MSESGVIRDGVGGVNKAEVDDTNALKVASAAIDSVGLFIENKSEVLLISVTTTTTQQATSSVQTNLNYVGALFYVIVSTTVTTTVRVNFQTTCDALARLITFASLSIDGVTGGTGLHPIHFYPGAVTVPNPLGGILPKTFQVLASITSSTSNTFTPSVNIAMKQVV